MTDRLDEQIRGLMTRVVEASPDAPDLDLADRPPTPVQSAARRRPAWVVALAAVIAVIVFVGLPLLLLGGGEQPAAERDEPVVEPTVEWEEPVVEDPALAWERVAEPPVATTLRYLWVEGDGTAFAYSGNGIWMSADGERWAQAGSNVPDLVTISSFADGFIGRDERGRVHWSPDGDQWGIVALPGELTPPHPALTLHYFAEAVAAGPQGIVVQGHASANVDPAAVEETFPELGPVTRLDRVAPCGPDGEPMACELDADDALWVWTEGSDEPQAVSLAAMGLTRADIWQGYRVVWFSADGATFETVASRPGERGYGPESEGLVATEAGFAMIDGDLWISPDGRDWQPQADLRDEIAGLVTVGSRVLGFTSGTQIVELLADGSQTLFADPAELQSSEVGYVDITTFGEFGMVAIGYEEMVFPEIAGEEPLTIARMLWFSVDGTEWHAQSLERSFGTFGAIEVAVMADRVVVGFGAEQPEDLELISQPEWWIGTIDN